MQSISSQAIARPLSQPTRLLAPAAVAERLAVSRSMVYALVRRGELPATYVGRLPRIAEADLTAYIERQRRGSEL